MARRALGQLRRLEQKWRSLRETALKSQEISNYSNLVDYEIEERHRIVTTIVTAIATCRAGGIGSSEFKGPIALFGYSANIFRQLRARSGHWSSARFSRSQRESGHIDCRLTFNPGR